MTEQEKAFRRAERKAKKMNDKEIAQAGLFADLPGVVKITTAKELIEVRRRQYVSKADGTSWGSVRFGETWNQPLEDLKIRAIERLAAGLLGEWFLDLKTYADKTYPKFVGKLGGHEYHRSFWSECLTMIRPVIIKQHLEFDPARITNYNHDGRYLVVDKVFPPEGWRPPLTRETFQALFPIHDPPLGPEPDDHGLFDKIMTAIQSSRTHQTSQFPSV